MPATVDGLLAWSRVFAVTETYRNYLGKLRLACEILRVTTACFEHPSIRRAKSTIMGLADAPRKKQHARRALVGQLISLAKKEGDLASAMLHLVAYAFLLRVPSELLPVVLGDNGCKHVDRLPPNVHSCLSMMGDKVRLQLARRKHKPHSSTMVRGCWCSSCQTTCPVHGLAPLLRKPGVGGRCPFVHLSAVRVNADLRRRLTVLRVGNADQFDTRCFRRGHCEDLAHSQSSLCEILSAGEWNSKRFITYLDKVALEDAAVWRAQAAGELSSDSE